MPAQAHQPNIVKSEKTEINNPEISRAFYGELNGQPENFIVKSDKQFLFYINLLVPDIKNVRKDFKVEINKINSGEIRNIYTLNGENFNWQPYYEEFGGDNYFKGPEMEKQHDAGTYELRVFNPDNQGKYVLAIGKTESFSLGEIFRTIITLPILKKNFFERSPFTAYFNYTGIFLLVILIIFALVVWFIFYFRKRKRNKINNF